MGSIKAHFWIHLHDSSRVRPCTGLIRDSTARSDARAEQARPSVSTWCWLLQLQPSPREEKRRKDLNSKLPPPPRPGPEKAQPSEWAGEALLLLKLKHCEDRASASAGTCPALWLRVLFHQSPPCGTRVPWGPRCTEGGPAPESMQAEVSGPTTDTEHPLCRDPRTAKKPGRLSRCRTWGVNVGR